MKNKDKKKLIDEIYKKLIKAIHPNNIIEMDLIIIKDALQEAFDEGLYIGYDEGYLDTKL